MQHNILLIYIQLASSLNIYGIQCVGEYYHNRGQTVIKSLYPNACNFLKLHLPPVCTELYMCMVLGKYSEWGDNCTDVTKKCEKWQEAGCPMHLLKVCWFPCTACPVRHPPMGTVETQSVAWTATAAAEHPWSCTAHLQMQRTAPSRHCSHAPLGKQTQAHTSCVPLDQHWML